VSPSMKAMFMPRPASKASQQPHSDDLKQPDDVRTIMQRRRMPLKSSKAAASSGGYQPPILGEDGILVPPAVPLAPLAKAVAEEQVLMRMPMDATKAMKEHPRPRMPVSASKSRANTGQGPDRIVVEQAVRMPVRASKSREDTCGEPPLVAEPPAPRMPMPPSKMQEEPSRKMPMLASKPVDLEVLVRAPETHQEEVHKNAPASSWMDVLRTEASLRLSEHYLSQTRKYFDAGQAPPESLDVEVERQALLAHGFDGDDAEVVEIYRRVARELPVEQREEIFFLKANDKLFRPGAIQVGHTLQGSMIPITTGLPASLHSLVSQHKRTILVASTST